MMDFKKIKNDFPIFSRRAKAGKRFIYLDNGATTHKPQQVIDAVVDFYAMHNSNVHRGLYDSGEQVTSLYEGSREKIAKFINAAKPEEVIFTSGTTDSINFVAQAWAIQNLKSGDEILITIAEHHSNMLPWQRVAKKVGAVLKFIPINKETFKVENPEKYLTPKTKLVAVTSISNVLGDIWQEEQLENLIKLAKQRGAKVLLDVAQAIAHKKIDVQKLDADFVAFSGHKMFSPTGVGVLYIKSELHEQVDPYKLGGGMVSLVTLEDANWAKPPQKFEAGTPPIAQAIGLGAAVDYIVQNINFDELIKHEAELCKILHAELNKIKCIKMAHNAQDCLRSGHLISFAVDGLHAHDIAGYVGGKGVSVRAGHHCAQPLARALGFESLVRVSLAAYNNAQDIEIFVAELKEALKFFGLV
jgi:cysteine desulfurase/selenocysteine lyase